MRAITDKAWKLTKYSLIVTEKEAVLVSMTECLRCEFRQFEHAGQKSRRKRLLRLVFSIIMKRKSLLINTCSFKTTADLDPVKIVRATATVARTGVTFTATVGVAFEYEVALIFRPRVHNATHDSLTTQFMFRNSLEKLHKGVVETFFINSVEPGLRSLIIVRRVFHVGKNTVRKRADTHAMVIQEDMDRQLRIE